MRNNNKIYLVSEIQCYCDDTMQKRFKAFSNIEEALEYKEQLVSLWDHELCDYYDCTRNELKDYIEVIRDYELEWSFLSSDCAQEVSIEVTAVELVQDNAVEARH